MAGIESSMSARNPLRAQNERELREFAERELREFVEKIKIRRERIQTHWNDSKSCVHFQASNSYRKTRLTP
jgi:hypothetical protein